MATERVILDSDVLVDLARGETRAIDLVDVIIRWGDRPAVSIVTEMELYLGARTKGEQRSIAQLFQRFRVLPISEMVSARARNLVPRYGGKEGRS